MPIADHDSAVRALLDKQEIHEVLARYLRAADRGDVAGLAACYLPGATEDHGGVFTGTADDYVASITQVLTHPKGRTMHCMTNVLIDLDGDTASVESYVVTFSAVRTADGRGSSFVGARLLDRFERRDGRWGIAHRALRWEWSHDAPAAETWLFGMLVGDTADLKRGGKFPSDPVYAGGESGAAR
ncbi:nuclear transport factor 2 family protein [Actinocorallia sp. A-T 12471]|uniref:nuclear transport factor 2 family protein n=1 Tax=Actinocorallia sp. A-T 12471 TaxID=3089813 RepID=UPI0029D401F4|nr:nuclear transport factor 2 family protein [Actinocorallia sp. A-T 12471]MDX6741166.1 nuclear transport factor 2 family protein [Actinocorallia sp. A-T 12471]